MRTSSKIGSLLINAGLVSEESWGMACSEDGDPVARLLKNEDLDEGAMLATLGQAASVPPVDLARLSPDQDAIESLARETCQERGILPVSRNGNILTIAVSDPFDVLLLDDLKRMTQCDVRTVLSHSEAIEESTKRLFESSGVAVDDLLEEVNAAGGTAEVKIEQEETEDIEMAAQGDDAPAVKLINVILLKALQEKASDIHVEPGDRDLRIRFRIDGRLHEKIRPPHRMAPAITSRIKIMAELDIAERRLPQDGDIHVLLDGRRVDLRVSTMSGRQGEKVVIRIIDSRNAIVAPERLGMSASIRNGWSELLAAPNGVGWSPARRAAARAPRSIRPSVRWMPTR